MIQVIHRALNILELVARNRDKEYTLSEISDGLGLNHGTCANIIKTLLARKYLEQTGKRQGYKLGQQAYYLTANYSNKRELLNVSVEPMKTLCIKLNESCILAIVKENMRIILHKELGTHELQVVSSNKEKHIYLKATGRMILASMTKDEQTEFVKKFGLPNEMWPEVQNEEDLFTELNKIKEKQCSVHFAESHIVGIGVPIYKNDKIVASLGVYLPEARFTYKAQEHIFSEMNKTAQYITREMGKIYPEV